ncbi:MAG: hypothetical protein LC798_15365 [Chloroflexi bacterium]|nr:hypothetical protein [Chloroflexota bacterium]
MRELWTQARGMMMAENFAGKLRHVADSPLYPLGLETRGMLHRAAETFDTLDAAPAEGPLPEVLRRRAEDLGSACAYDKALLRTAANALDKGQVDPSGEQLRRANAALRRQIGDLTAELTEQADRLIRARDGQRQAEARVAELEAEAGRMAEPAAQPGYGSTITGVIPAGRVSPVTEFVFIDGLAFVNAAKHEKVVWRIATERDRLRAAFGKVPLDMQARIMAAADEDAIEARGAEELAGLTFVCGKARAAWKVLSFYSADALWYLRVEPVSAHDVSVADRIVELPAPFADITASPDGPPCAKVVAVDDPDEWDPRCVRPRGHDGPCATAWVDVVAHRDARA